MQIMYRLFVAQTNIVLSWCIPKKLKMISQLKRTMLATIATQTNSSNRLEAQSEYSITWEEMFRWEKHFSWQIKAYKDEIDKLIHCTGPCLHLHRFTKFLNTTTFTDYSILSAVYELNQKKWRHLATKYLKLKRKCVKFLSVSLVIHFASQFKHMQSSVSLTLFMYLNILYFANMTISRIDWVCVCVPHTAFYSQYWNVKLADIKWSQA